MVTHTRNKTYCGIDLAGSTSAIPDPVGNNIPRTSSLTLSLCSKNFHQTSDNGELKVEETFTLLSLGVVAVRESGRAERATGESAIGARSLQTASRKGKDAQCCSPAPPPSPRKRPQTPRTPSCHTFKTSSGPPARMPSAISVNSQTGQVTAEIANEAQSVTIQDTSIPRHSPPSSQLSRQASTDSDVISNDMSLSEIADIMRRHDCTDLTDQLDGSSFGSYAVSRGGFGDVFQGRLLSGDPIAVKLAQIYTDSDHSRKHIKSTARELHTWSKCNHPNVVSLLGFAEFRGQIAMVSPWIDNGNLPTFLGKNPLVDRWILCKGIAKGLAYLHKLKLIHGDLKGANVLISAKGNPMLTDFGGSKLLTSSIEFSDSSILLLLAVDSMFRQLQAPEVLDPDLKCTNHYAADVYSLGMVSDIQE
ncbi:unnamed protein product [Rhizoctonia solani]|uniref:Protein kinase domain-containing protein n=1 Tax=Rhizoctonia solani TaxID=456999 RepID=A0A8H3D2D3_9AGAM|nr:unnamed protein product [Rhizoctonia solani]